MDDGEVMDGIRRRIVRVVLVPLSALPRRSSEEKSAIHGWRKKALRRQTKTVNAWQRGKHLLDGCCPVVEGHGGVGKRTHSFSRGSDRSTTGGTFSRCPARTDTCQTL